MATETEGNRGAKTGGVAVNTGVDEAGTTCDGSSGLSDWSVCSVGPCCSGVPRSSLFFGGLAGGSCPNAGWEGGRTCVPSGGQDGGLGP